MKINSALKALNQDITNVNITGGTGTIKNHHELPDTATENCHPIFAITGLIDNLNSLSASIDNLRSIIVGYDSRIVTVEDKVTAMQAKVNTLTTKVNELTTEVNELSSTVADHETRIKALEDK